MILRFSTKFKKDLKRYQNRPSKIEVLKQVLRHLKDNGSVPAEYLPHRLTGNFKGYMECHIEDDFLLIWIDENTNTIKLVRLGSHHELFGK